MEKKALINGLDFVLPMTDFNEETFIANIESFFTSLLGVNADKHDWEEKGNDEEVILNLTPEQLIMARKLRSLSDKFYHQVNMELKTNRKKEVIELRKTLKNLSNDKNIYITKPDKGKGVVILNRKDYNEKMESILSDAFVFQIINEDPTLKKEEKLLRTLNKMKMRNFITSQEFNHFKPKGSRPARLYGLPKTHRLGVPLRPIVSGIGSFNYGIGKLLARRLSHLRTSNNSLKDTFSFIEFIRKLPCEMASCRMVSFDVTNLFTKVPLEYTIDVILDKLYGEKHDCSFKKPRIKMENWCKKCLDRHDMNTLLTMATLDTHFLFNGKIYRQFNGVSMGSPLAPIIADIFMIHLEEQLLPDMLKAGVKTYKRYVDDTFLLIDHNADIEQIKSILNSFHKDIQFTSVSEENVLSMENLQPHLIDRFWLQRIIGKEYAKPSEAAVKTQEVFDVLRMVTKDDELENQLTHLLGYDQPDLIKTLKIHRHMIVYCTLLATAPSTWEKEKIEQVMRNDPKFSWILQALRESDRIPKQLSFLDVLIIRDFYTFTTTIYRKNTYSGLLTKWNSYVPRSYKISAISNMI